MNLTGKCKEEFEAWLDGQEGTYDLLQKFASEKEYAIYVETMNEGGYRSVVESPGSQTTYGSSVQTVPEAQTDVESLFNTVFNAA